MRSNYAENKRMRMESVAFSCKWEYNLSQQYILGLYKVQLIFELKMNAYRVQPTILSVNSETAENGKNYW